MQVIDGIVTIVQESRFQLVDGRGVAHLLSLGGRSLAEPDQLAGLAARQARVRVECHAAPNVIGLVARSVSTL